jgi:hypothetical protein
VISHDEIVRIYQKHFGHSHEAGLFAVFAAGVADGRQQSSSETAAAVIPPPVKVAAPAVKAPPPKATPPKAPVAHASFMAPSVAGGTSTSIERWVETGQSVSTISTSTATTSVPGPLQPR